MAFIAGVLPEMEVVEDYAGLHHWTGVTSGYALGYSDAAHGKPSNAAAYIDGRQ